MFSHIIFCIDILQGDIEEYWKMLRKLEDQK